MFLGCLHTKMLAARRFINQGCALWSAGKLLCTFKHFKIHATLIPEAGPQ